jgi:hypothetical protein
MVNACHGVVGPEGVMVALSKPTRRFVGAVIAMAVVLASCTTFVRPTTCARGSTTCGGPSDLRFCEYLAVAVEGTGCAELGIVESKPFCVVRPGACIDTEYAVTDRNCRVLRQEVLRNAARDECPTGAPMFASR